MPQDLPIEYATIYVYSAERPEAPAALTTAEWGALEDQESALLDIADYDPMRPRFISVVGTELGHVLVSNQTRGPARLVAMNVTRTQFRAPIGRTTCRPGTKKELIDSSHSATAVG